jgi:hypothetical protein
MNNLLKINFSKRRSLTSLLGLALDGNRLEGVVLRRTNGSLQRRQTFSVALTLDPLTAAPELVGREIRNHLDAAGVRERRCVVGVPLKWALTAHTELPPLSEADAASLLQLEAERGFPCDAATLRIASSRCPLANAQQHVLLAGIPDAQLTALEKVLAAARLKPVSLALGLAALQSPADLKSNGVLALAIGESHVALQITCGGGVAALRALEGALDNEAGRRTLHADQVAREVRITLGQLPAGLRETVKRIRIYGPRELALQLADEMDLRFEAAGLSAEVVTTYAPDEFGVQLPPDASWSTAFSLAARPLARQPAAFEFLPPRRTAIEQLAARYASGRFRTAGAVAAGIALLVGGLFFIQQIQLWWLRAQWSAMAVKVQTLETTQQQVRQYRAWYDESFRTLSILQQVSAAFPEDGVVTAKTIEIREGNGVSCSGNARDNASLLKMLAQLRTTTGITDLKVDQIRGKSPMQFTFDFHWNGGGREN